MPVPKSSGYPESPKVVAVSVTNEPLSHVVVWGYALCATSIAWLLLHWIGKY